MMNVVANATAFLRWMQLVCRVPVDFELENLRWSRSFCVHPFHPPS